MQIHAIDIFYIPVCMYVLPYAVYQCIPIPAGRQTKIHTNIHRHGPTLSHFFFSNENINNIKCFTFKTETLNNV